MIILHPTREFRFPLIAECINPDVFHGKTIEEIGELKIWEGNKQKKLRELFKVEEAKTENSSDDEAITIRGNVGKVRRIGAGMKNGKITVYGDVGMHLGVEIKGGEINVYGNVDGGAGAMMKGGIIKIHGNAGAYLGAPYRGSSEGMRGGKIIVYGDVGNEAGAYMRNGIIKVYGCAGQFLGFRMRNGTIYVQKDSDGRAGACMRGGKIVIEGFLESALPTFTIEGVKERVKIEGDETVVGPFYLFVGDLAEHGEGKLYVSKERNTHLNHYEKLFNKI
ncbi:MAG: formylmethanofuran dehydrogenase subunit C [Candidatus Bathyarchaeia archaeon]